MENMASYKVLRYDLATNTLQGTYSKNETQFAYQNIFVTADYLIVGHQDIVAIFDKYSFKFLRNHFLQAKIISMTYIPLHKVFVYSSNNSVLNVCDQNLTCNSIISTHNDRYNTYLSFNYDYSIMASIDSVCYDFKIDEFKIVFWNTSNWSVIR